MVTQTELDTFIKKFHQLWNDGHTAHLDLDTCAGQAWVGLRVQLGHAPGPLHHQQLFNFPKKSLSPSRQRRCERRAAARDNIDSAENADHFTSVEQTESETAQNTTEKDRSEDVNNDLEEVEAVEVLP